MKILLLGKTGLLGSEFREILTREKSNFLAPNRKELDVLDFEQVEEFFAGNKIDLIIYCVAWTDVDGAEKSREKCHNLNVKALENILKYQIPIIHFSTDYVFDGAKNDEITESFPQNPANFYGETKAEAEKLLENFAQKWWNIRTSWLFGKGGKNFISTIIDKSETKKSLKIVNDEIGRPTSAKDLAEFVFAGFVQKELPVGHYHLQNNGEATSWANLARFCLAEKGVKTKITEISSQELKRSAKRPINSVLKSIKLEDEMQNWQESVKEFLG